VHKSTKLSPQLVIRLLPWPELGTTSWWLLKRSLFWISSNPSSEAVSMITFRMLMP
jgi:hypothetical protein|tara:strand:- start:57110 stop:57277 length:168 start_codon:yes stop_codon:yes gene_type:complete